MLTKCSNEHRDLFVKEINPGAEALERLDAYDAENDNVSVIATAAIEAFLEINPDDWQLSIKART